MIHGMYDSKEKSKIRESFVQDIFVHNSSAKWSTLHFAEAFLAKNFWAISQLLSSLATFEHVKRAEK